MSSPKSIRRSTRAAFTLIELLTVIAIIGILAAIIIPTVGKVRATARNAQCIANLREWGRGIMLYANDNKGTYTTKNFGSAGGSGPYKAYIANNSDTQYSRVRACPASPEAVANNTLTYSMVRPNINGALASASLAERLPLNKAKTPSQFMLMADARSNSNTSVNSSETSIKDVLGPLFDATQTSEINTRHGSQSINAVFADGSMKRITGTPVGQGDQFSVYERSATWFLLY